MHLENYQGQREGDEIIEGLEKYSCVSWPKFHQNAILVSWLWSSQSCSPFWAISGSCGRCYNGDWHCTDMSLDLEKGSRAWVRGVIRDGQVEVSMALTDALRKPALGGQQVTADGHVHGCAGVKRMWRRSSLDLLCVLLLISQFVQFIQHSCSHKHCHKKTALKTVERCFHAWALTRCQPLCTCPALSGSCTGSSELGRRPSALPGTYHGAWAPERHLQGGATSLL